MTDALTSLVEVSHADDHFSLLTPVELPDGDAVALTVRDTSDGLRVTDSHTAMWQLTGAINTDAFARDLARIEKQFGVDLLDEQFVATVTDVHDLGDVCLRVAQASAALVAARSGKEINARRPKAALRRRVAADLRGADVEVREDEPIEGASGHPYRVELFLPKGEEVVALVPTLTFENAQTVFTKLSDISKVNGYKAVVILDDPTVEGKVTPERRLLSQVAEIVLASNLAPWVLEVSEAAAH